MKPISLRGGECSSAGGIQEKFRQPSARSALIWIPAMGRGLDSMALEAPFSSIIPWFYDSIHISWPVQNGRVEQSINGATHFPYMVAGLLSHKEHAET